VPSPVGPEHVEALGQARDVGLEDPGVGAARVQKYQRLSLPVLLVVRPHIAELGVVGHCRLLS